jgi:hypothetical protein
MDRMKDMNPVDALQELFAEYDELETAMIKLLADYVRVRQELAKIQTQRKPKCQP